MKRLVLLFAFIALSAFLTYGQEVTGEILGKVTLAEDGSPLPGVTVTLTGRTYGRLDVVTTKEGSYRFWKLAPGDYELKFVLQGFKSVVRSGIRVNVLSTKEVDVAMETGGIEEEVTVVGEVPLINTRKASVAASYTSEEVNSMPVARRTSEIVNMAPGTMSAHPQIAGSGTGVIHGFGVRFQVGEFSMDGASFRSTYGASGMPTGVNTVRVEETQVTTSGQDITNVQGGATVNFVTKRGGNRLSGESYIALMDKSLQSNKKLPANMGPAPTPPEPGVVYLGNKGRAGVYRTYDYGVALGGPILQDHIWFFGSWGVIDSQTKGNSGAIADRYYTPDMYGKMNFQWKKTTLELAYAHTDSQAVNVDFSTAIVTVNKLDRANPYDTYTAQVTQTLGDKLLLSGKLTYFAGKTATHQANFAWTGAGDVSYEEGRTYNPKNRYYTYNYYKNPPYNTEATGHWQHYGDQQKRPYFVLEANYFAERVLGGDHEFKAGLDRNYSRFIEEYMAPNQMFVQDYPSTSSSSVPNNAPGPFNGLYYWGRLQTYNDRYGEKRAERTGVYLQDIMSYGRLTATIGMRMDWHAVAWEPVTYHGLAPNDDPSLVAGWAQWTGETSVEGGKLSVDPTFSPRVTLTYDLTGKGKDILKAMYADYGGMFESGIRISAGFKGGNTRGEFTMPFIDYNNNYIPDWGTNEIFFLNWFGRFPNPTDVQNIAKVTQAETPILEAKYGKGQVPWNAWTYPGWMYVSFAGNPLGNQAQGKDPTDYLADSYTPEKIREFLLSYEKMLSNDFSVQILGAYKKNYNLQWARGYTGTYASPTLLPNDTSKLMGTDPTTGWDIYQRDAKYPTPSGYMYDAYQNTYNDFKGLELIFTKRFSHGWMIQGSGDLQDWSYHADKGETGMSTLFDFNNDAPYQAYQYRSTEPGQNVTWHFKISGLVALPLGINLSGFLDARQGYPINGNWVTSYLGQTLPNKGDKYGDYRMPDFYYMNFTLEKQFKFSDNVSSTIYGTLYNATDVMKTTTINEAKVPTTLDQPTSVNNPRVLQIGVRFSFR